MIIPLVIVHEARAVLIHVGMFRNGKGSEDKDEPTSVRT